MALENQVFALFFVMCTAVVIANHCTKHAASQGEKEVTEEIKKREDEIKNQQKKVKALVDRIAAEIERESCTVPPLPSCSHLKKSNPEAKDGNYSIDPDGEGGLAPFTVYCNMTYRSGVGVTVISHDSESNTSVKGYEDPGVTHMIFITQERPCLSWRALPESHYIVSSLSSMSVIIRHCSKDTATRGKGGGCLATQERWTIGVDHQSVVSAHAGRPTHAQTPVVVVTAIRMTNAWREDSGLLTDKTSLPVKQLRFGDTGSTIEEGYHTLAKFKCYGIA